MDDNGKCKCTDPLHKKIVYKKAAAKELSLFFQRTSITIQNPETRQNETRSIRLGNLLFFKIYRQAEERKRQWNLLESGFQRFQVNGQDSLTSFKNIGGIQCKGDHRALLYPSYVSSTDQNKNHPFATSFNLGLHSVIGMTVAHKMERSMKKKSKLQSELDRSINDDIEVKEQKKIVDQLDGKQKKTLHEILKLNESCADEQPENVLTQLKLKSREYEELNRQLDLENSKLAKIRALKYPEKGKVVRPAMDEIQRDMARLQKTLHSTTSKFLIERAEIDFLPSMNKDNSLVEKKVDGLGATNVSIFAALGFCKFRDMHTFRRSLYGGDCLDAKEPYSTMGCRGCGKLQDIGTSKMHVCDEADCGERIPRDEGAPGMIFGNSVAFVRFKVARRRALSVARNPVRQATLVTQNYYLSLKISKLTQPK